MDRGDLGLLTANISSYLEELQKCWFRDAGFLNEGHGIGEVIDVITIYIQHHGLGELWGMRREDCLDKSHFPCFYVHFLHCFSISQYVQFLLRSRDCS